MNTANGSVHTVTSGIMATPLFTGKHPDEVQRTFIPRRLFNGKLVQRTNAQDHSLGRPDGASMPRFLGEEPRPPQTIQSEGALGEPRSTGCANQQAASWKMAQTRTVHQPSYTHIHTHTHTHTDSHVQTHTHTHTDTLTHTLTHTQTDTHTYRHTHTHTHTDAHTYRHTHTNPQTHTYRQTHTHTHTHTDAHTYRHTHTNPQTHTYRQTHTHTQTYTMLK